MKKPLNELVPRLARGARPSAAIASGLLAPLAMGAPGDLDPGFADVGRLVQIVDLEGPIWSVEALDSGNILVAGGDVDRTCNTWYCYYDTDWEATNFVSQLTAEGSVDPAFNAARPADIELRDAARQSDGKVIAVGRRLVEESVANSRLVVYRLEPGGSLDTTFGVDGIFELSAAAHGNLSTANAVILDPDGDIVVAGSRGDELIVLRLLAGGTLDDSFGDAGVSIGPSHDYNSGAHIVRTATGGYRVTTSSNSQCQVIGLTADGDIDNSFGVAGIAAVTTALDYSNWCDAIASQAEDRLLVVGSEGGRGFAASLSETGALDPSFAPDAVASVMRGATAVVEADDGKILVAGWGNDIESAMILRLTADGGLDPLFGNAGSTLIDLPSEYGSEPAVHDLDVHPDGTVIAAGGDQRSDSPFVVRLLGEGGGDGPGVLSVQSFVTTPEGDETVVNVRRTGGKTGTVSVAYQTMALDPVSATGGQDYGEVSDRLTWADGDMSTREIVVEVHDDTGAAEEHEYFEIALSDVQGGAGVGTRHAIIGILPDGEPGGQFAIYDSGNFSEIGLPQINVYRNFYGEGAVSVTVTPVAGTAAAGGDFIADPVTISWADQDFDPKQVDIPLIDDAIQEGNESFTLELSNPTGGAVIGPHSVVTITIEANDAPVPPPPPPRRSGGGGSAGFLSLLFLGFAELFRSLQRSARIRR